MFKLLLSLIVVMLTVLVVAVDPKLHKPVMIGSKETIVEMNSAKTDNLDLKIAPQNAGVKSETLQINPIDNTAEREVVQEEYMLGLKKRIREREEKYAQRRTASSQVSLPQAETESVSQTEPEKPSFVSDTKILAQLNEFIVWNKWRADVCNTIADNSLNKQSYYLKKGVLFRYSFKVDNKRHITNVKVSFSNADYDSIIQSSVQDIRNAILSMEGKKILTFPAGSQREWVQVEGGIQMSDYDRSLNPGNFSDIESVFK